MAFASPASRNKNKPTILQPAPEWGGYSTLIVALTAGVSERYAAETETALNRCERILTRGKKMIKVCLRDGFAVFEFASAVAYVEAFPDGLSQDSLDLGSYVELSNKESNDVSFERRQVNNKRQLAARRVSDLAKRRSISELMVERD